MEIHAPQIIYIVLVGLTIGSSLAKYGQQKTDHYDWMDILFGPAISVGLLYWGGFFGG